MLRKAPTSSGSDGSRIAMDIHQDPGQKHKTKKQTMQHYKLLGVLLLLVVLLLSQIGNFAEELPSVSRGAAVVDEIVAPKPEKAPIVDPRLWQNFKTPETKKAAIKRVLPYIGEIAAEATANGNDIIATRRYTRPNGCSISSMGSGWGAHDICSFTTTKPLAGPPPCAFVSMGISNDYSFDVDMANKLGCYGFAADPTVAHKSSLHSPLVTFHKIGATMLGTAKGIGRRWVSVSMPTIVNNILDAKKLNVLKMDCEGCEYALARDVLVEDPGFFHKVDQVSIEIHVCKQFLSSDEHLYNLGLLFELFKEAGLVMQSLIATPCGPAEPSGCPHEFKELGFPCGLVPGQKEGYSCHNYLFARNETKPPPAAAAMEDDKKKPPVAVDDKQTAVDKQSPLANGGGEQPDTKKAADDEKKPEDKKQPPTPTDNKQEPETTTTNTNNNENAAQPTTTSTN